MKKLAAIGLSLFLLSCHKERVSTNSSSSQTSDQSSNQTVGQSPIPSQSKRVWPFVTGNYWVYRDSTFNEDGTLTSASLIDTLKVADSTNYNSKFYFGPDPVSAKTYYREANDSTIEYYDGNFKTSQIYFKEVGTNKTIITKIEGDETISLNGYDKNYHILHEQIGYTGFTKINSLDSCIKNELVETYSGDTTYKLIIYMKPGVGMVKYILYLMKNQTPGLLYLYFKRDILAYKVQ
ncbi:MAG: hypothetical protein ACTHNG_03155 [Ginsengibacter sp.]